MFRASQRAGLPALLWLCTGGAQAASVPPTPPELVANVIPAPAQVAVRAGSFHLRGDTPLLMPADKQSRQLARYLAELVHASHGLALRPLIGRGAPTSSIALRLDAAAPPGDESYRLQITESAVRVSARTHAGLFYGAVTLWQLISAQQLEAGAVSLPALELSDAPRFRWRGLMLDSARHFQSPEFIRRYIDWMALHKLNMLGWHLTDDQGWRLEIKKYPRLTTVGAWRVPQGNAPRHDIDPATGRPRLYGGFYTQAEVRRIVAYAAERNVTIVPEIDMPGHATAAIVAYPRLGVPAEPPHAVPSDWGIYPNLFNVEESTFAFLEDVLAEVLQLFPGAYVHVGGDEAVKDQWRASARVQSRMRELGVRDAGALQGYFTHRIGEYLQAHGRRLIGWDEILAGGAPAGAAVMSWRGVDGAIAAAASGHDAVLSPAPTLYLDHRQGSGPEEPPGRGAVMGLRGVYDFDPLPGKLAGAAQHLLGVQANLWTEHVRTEQQAAYMTWPRAAALAEVGWSMPERRDWANFLGRLPAEFVRYRSLGIHYSASVFAPPRRLLLTDRHMSQDLSSCTNKLVLNLEDDAPLDGPRAVFLVDIENPCWIMPAELSQQASLSVAVGQVPFNFQIGADRDAIRLDTPISGAGELEVRIDGCEGEPALRLPLAPAAGNDAVTVLPAVPLPQLPGAHSLCLRFAQHGLDPLWVIDWLQLSPAVP